MAYPRKAKGEDVNAVMQPLGPAVSPSVVPKVPGVRGGAPTLTKETYGPDPNAPTLTVVNTPAVPIFTVGGDPAKSTTETFRRTVKEFWRRDTPETQRDQPSADLALHPASPWKPEELDAKWGPLVTELEKKLWDRYSNLPPEQQAQAYWQQVGMNAQQVARSLATRMLINGAGVERPQMDSTSLNRLAQMDIRQWLAALPKKV